MSVEFLDTNILVYAHDRAAGTKRDVALRLLTRLVNEDLAAISTQVMSEFYSVATRKLRINVTEVEAILMDMSAWHVHSPAAIDAIEAARMCRSKKVSWWDALIVTSAASLGCSTLWSEDMRHSSLINGVRVRNPFVQ